ncbi:type II secretion system minor pseudopilin [Gimesia panareensis]|uniref:general secretion pathway protein GspK n=1 Tax=Gimesia panareensis TaxID=2527978 RepID=UPI001189515E|nr:type II secretion system protein GspK [Gimesia panareensis]QDU52791.1 General secretion pathway protein K [Gimesia panareensis]
MKHTRHSQFDSSYCGQERAGSTLLVVLVVVVMLSLGAYTFSELMIVEMEATNIYGRSLQSRELALSGIELAAAYVGDRSEIDGWNSYHNPSQFQNINLVPGEVPRVSGYFSVVAPVVTDAQSKTIRFGLSNESGKLNLNILATEEEDELDLELETEDVTLTAVDRLMYIPNMTEEIASAILDWIDEDDDPRAYGAESDYYSTLESPYYAKNAPLESLDELLLVRDVTPELLYGEDTNRNGILDPNENDGDVTLPLDNADGVLDAGWSAYLTVHSREINIRPDGSEKINVNQTMLTELYDELETELGPDEARFIVAYRLSGPVQTADDLDSGPTLTTVGGSMSGQQALNELANGLAKAMFSEEGVTVTRGGMDLSAGAAYSINSIYDLIGSEVETEIDGTKTTLSSPWPADASSMTTNLPILHDLLTTTKNQYIEGRIQISEARLETLLGIPEMDDTLAHAIVNAQMTVTNGAASTEISQARQTTGWLVIEGLTTIEQMRKLAPYICSGGDVFRVQSLGYFGQSGQMTRMEAIIDGTFIPPRITYVRDLSNLGAGYDLSTIQGTQQDQ